MTVFHPYHHATWLWTWPTYLGNFAKTRVGHRYVHMSRCLYYTKKKAVWIYIYIHTRIYTVSYVHTRIWFLYIFFRGFQNMFSYYLWGPQLIVSRNVPRCKPIVGPIRTRKWIHLVQYPTPVAVWILNLKNCIAEWKCKQTINIYNHAAVAAK